MRKLLLALILLFSTAICYADKSNLYEDLDMNTHNVSNIGTLGARATTVTSLTDSGLTSGRVPFASTNGLLVDSANLTYSGTRLSPNYITLAAGTATAGTAPLKFTAGVVTTAAVAGQIEYITGAFAIQSDILGIGTAVPGGYVSAAITGRMNAGTLNSSTIAPIFSANRINSDVTAFMLGSDTSKNGIMMSNNSQLRFGKLVYDIFNEYLTMTTAGFWGFGTTAPLRRVDINEESGNCLRLIYNDSDGSAASYTDFLINSTGDLSIMPTANRMVGIGTTVPGGATDAIFTVRANSLTHNTSTIAYLAAFNRVNSDTASWYLGTENSSAPYNAVIVSNNANMKFGSDYFGIFSPFLTIIGQNGDSNYGNLLLTTTSKLEFNASTESLNSANAGHLDLNAATSIDLNAPIYTTSPFNSAATQTTTNGLTGTAVSSQPFAGTSYKKFIVYLTNFTSAGTVLTFPTAFVKTPYVYGDAAAIAIAVTTTTTTTLTSVGAVAGFIIIEGY